MESVVISSNVNIKFDLRNLAEEFRVMLVVPPKDKIKRHYYF